MTILRRLGLREAGGIVGLLTLILDSSGIDFLLHDHTWYCAYLCIILYAIYSVIDRVMDYKEKVARGKS